MDDDAYTRTNGRTVRPRLTSCRARPTGAGFAYITPLAAARGASGLRVWVNSGVGETSKRLARFGQPSWVVRAVVEDGSFRAQSKDEAGERPVVQRTRTVGVVSALNRRALPTHSQPFFAFAAANFVRETVCRKLPAARAAR